MINLISYLLSYIYVLLYFHDRLRQNYECHDNHTAVSKELKRNHARSNSSSNAKEKFINFTTPMCDILSTQRAYVRNLVFLFLVMDSRIMSINNLNRWVSCCYWSTSSTFLLPVLNLLKLFIGHNWFTHHSW